MNISYQNIKIEKATESDHWELLTFLVTNYPDLGWTKKFMQWQYYENPAGIAKSWVAKHNGNVIANYTAIPHTLLVNGKPEKSWRVQDVITHPDYRGLGLYSKLSDSANGFLQQVNFPLNFTFPNENSHQGFIKRNWINPNKIPLWMNHDVKNLEAKELALNIEPLTEFTQKDEQIWKSYSKSTAFTIDRSAAYLNWRYIGNPRGGYYPFRLSDGDLSAVCIIKIYVNDKGEKFSHLLDCFYEEGFEKIHEIIAFFMQYSNKDEVKLASAWFQPQSEIAKHLIENNFELNLNLTRWHVLNINSSTLDKTKVSNFSNWHISMGDTDVY